jgi:hypothetical protein
MTERREQLWIVAQVTPNGREWLLSHYMLDTQRAAEAVCETLLKANGGTGFRVTAWVRVEESAL